MRLVIPYCEKLDDADARLVRFAELLGCDRELLPLRPGAALTPAYIEEHVGEKNCCFVINVAAVQSWMSDGVFSAELDEYLVSHFAFVFIHNLRSETFSDDAVRILSGGRFQSVRRVEQPSPYEITADCKAICGPLAGLKIAPSGPPANDLVFTVDSSNREVRTLIGIGGLPFCTSVHRRQSEVFFLGNNVVDVDAAIKTNVVAEYFSQLVPPAMVLRHMFGDECWRPNEPHATLIIDDPLLRSDYGFLNFKNLLALTDEYNFHTSIAFIPHNYRRTSNGIARMFRERADRLSICFHGNDHTSAELASKDEGLLNAMLTTARARMSAHEKQTGIECDKVMVFPQGHFSKSAMSVLKANNFHAAVNTVHSPLEESAALTVADAIQPAVLKYDGFPLFLRSYVRDIPSHEAAFNIFFGRPVFIVEHHDVFSDPACVTELVTRLNMLAPLRWSKLDAAIEKSHLVRRVGNTLHVRAYASALRIENDTPAVQRYAVEWPQAGGAIEKVLLNGVSCPDAQISDSGVRISFDLLPRETRKVVLVFRNEFELSHANRTLKWTVKAYVRRRLSETRDNYLVRNPRLFSAARFFQRKLLGGTTTGLTVT